MGFGLLFIGYFIAFLMTFNNYAFFFEIVGYAIMLTAVGKLTEYKHSLARASMGLLLMSLCAAYDALRLADSWLALNLPIFGDNAAMTVSLFAAASTLLFHFLLLTSIREIAMDAEESELAGRSYLALALAALCCVLEFAVVIVGNLIPGDVESALRILTLVATLARVLYPIAVLAFLYSCYARICAPEDTDMPQRPSRFAFVNKWREKRAQKAEEVQHLRDGYQKDLEEKFHKKQNDIKNKKNKK